MQSNYFAVDQAGKIARLRPVDFTSNREELKDLLVENTGLLSGRLDTLENSEEWLLITQGLPLGEVGVPQESGWVCDLVFADPGSRPVFVHCLPDFSNRSRWELIGQMMEYTAAARKSLGSSPVEDWVGRQHMDVREAVRRSFPAFPESAAEFCARVDAALHEGQAHLIYVAAGYPEAAQQAVEFVNGQVDRLAVSLVEIREYRAPGFRMLIPSLSGEEETLVPTGETAVEAPPKEAEPDLVVDESPQPPDPQESEYSIESELTDSLPDHDEAAQPFPGNGNGNGDEIGKAWDESSFFRSVEQNLAAAQIQAVRTLFQSLQKLSYGVNWAGESEKGAMEVHQPFLTDQPILTLFTDGKLCFNFGNLEGTPELEGHQQKLRASVDDRLGVVFTLDEDRPSMRPSEWCPKVTGLLRVLDDLVSYVN